MKSFFIFLKNSLNNNLHLIEHQDKRKTFLCQLCSLKVYLVWWTPLCNTYYHRFHFLLKFASHYDRDEREMKHGCCKQILFLNEYLAKEFNYLVEKWLWLQSGGRSWWLFEEAFRPSQTPFWQSMTIDQPLF